MKLFLILMTVLLNVSFLNGQNLVYNSSFESENMCPWTYSQFHAVNLWTMASRGTCDYYNSCVQEGAPLIVKIPRNFFGFQPAKTGNAYAGFYTFYSRNYREYIEGQLHKKLEKGKQYKINAYVSLADTAGVAVKELGVAFTPKLYKARHDTVFSLKATPLKGTEVFLEDKVKWMLIEGVYEANGTERYLIIGNFNNNEATDTLRVRNERAPRSERHVSYYYIDDVCVSEIIEDGSSTCDIVKPLTVEKVNTPQPIKDDKKPKVGETFRLEKVYFDFDKATLRPESETELNQLYELLIRYPDISIVINGHTDSKGNDQYNLSLSEARALAIYAYLVKKGINSDRLDFKGYGENRPIATNETEKGRQMNRRVEFVVVSILN